MSSVLKYWCIRRTPETCDKINEWFTKKTKHRFTSRNDYNPPFMSYKEYWTYLHYPPINGKYLFKSRKRGYTEITFDTFIEEIYHPPIRFLKK